MRNTAKLLSAGAFALLLAAGPSRTVQAQAPAPAPAAPGAAGAPATAPAQGPTPTFRVSVDLVTTDAIVRDSKTDQFIADLKAGEFEVYEDGVKQDLASLVLIHGGRAYNVQSPPPAPLQEGIILPRNKPTNDAAGRIFLLFVDDLHLDFRSTPRTREIFKKMLRNLIHDGDMFGIVSTGPSSLSVQLTYDRAVLESAISRITGGGLRPSEIIKGMQGSQGPAELRHRAQVAFSTGYDLMKNLEKVQNRRKAVIWVSSGYDFNPFEKSRLEDQAQTFQTTTDDLLQDPFVRNQQSTNALNEADLVHELAELTRAANRANATFYTIDPRGLIAGQDIDEEVNQEDWMQYVRETQDSLRVLAEQTGGIAVVNQNDFDKALKRIDAETSDYYVLGFYSSNGDPLKRTRKIEIKTTRPGLNVWSRTSYSLRPLPPVPTK
jgi:VWFA-related protein